MENEKYVGNKRKSLIDDMFDDSFEVFLPNKLKEKSIMSQSHFSSRNREKKASPTSSASNTSQETYDTDMEQVMTVCLSKGISKISNATTKEMGGKNWKDLSSKTKRRPLLITRTMAEREAILSQKLALILVDNNENNDSCSNSYSLVEMEDPIQSDLLLQQWCKKCRLWSAARLQSLKIEDFYIAALSNYVELNEICTESSNIKNTSVTLDLEKTQANINKNDEFTKSSLHEDSFMLHNDCLVSSVSRGEQSAADIFGTYQMEESYNRDNVYSPEIDKASTSGTCNNNASRIETITSSTTGNEAISAEIIELSSSPSSDRTVHLLPINKLESPIIFSPTHSISSIATENCNQKIGMLDRVGVTLLAQQWENLFNSNEGDITVMLDNGATINLHKFVLSVRCQPLIYEINEDKLLWSMYSFDAAKAFFRYVYTGKCDHLWYLTSLDKATVRRLAHLYELNHLEEVLIKLHDCTYPRMSFESRNHKSSKILNCSSTLLLSKSPMQQLTSWIKPQNSRRNSEDENHSTIKDMSDVEINSISNGDNNQCQYNTSPSPPYNYFNSLQTDTTNRNIAHCTVKKSLEAYFQESFPELPNLSLEAISVGTNPTTNEVDMRAQNEEKLIASFSESPGKRIRNKNLIVSPLISSSSPKSWSSCTSDKIDVPSTSLVHSPSAMKSLQSTPTCTSSEIFFSKNVTPFPDYDAMITPQLKRELKKFGLKGDLGSTKAKLLLKYIYDQIHPVVESDKEQEIISTQTQSPGSEKFDSLTTLIGNLVKSNSEFYTHILLFKPIWLENFYQLLKEQGIVCSVTQLKDALNTLGITYRTKNTRERKPSKKPNNR